VNVVPREPADGASFDETFGIVALSRLPVE
jgi:hypothetical protein